VQTRRADDSNGDSNSSSQRLTAATGDSAHNSRTIRANLAYARPEKRTVVRLRSPAKNLAYALRARAPEMPPNSHQQSAIATSSNLRT
jgi:hypothetical protein